MSGYPEYLQGEALYRCAVASVYACECPDQLQEATRLLNALPAASAR